jgi:phosphopantetheinyl transferase
MWLKTLGVDMTEICNRLGHDQSTYIKHYGSPSLFQTKDKQLMIKILGDIYNIK